LTGIIQNTLVFTHKCRFHCKAAKDAEKNIN